MKYDHTVKHNGKIYPAGTEVPVGIADFEKIKEEQEVEKAKRGRKPKED